jgi:hypothetical protein
MLTETFARALVTSCVFPARGTHRLSHPDQSSLSSWRMRVVVSLLAGWFFVAAARAQTTVSIDAAMSNQTFEGWGTSLAWWANSAGTWTNTTNYNNLMSSLFSPTSGLGLSYIRYNIGGGDTSNCGVNATVNDTGAGAGTNQFNYSGSGWGYSNQPGAYSSDNHYDGTANDYYTFQFVGTQVTVYGSWAPNNGILAYSVDGGTETTLDLYAGTRTDDQILFVTPLMASGTHTLKVRVTGTKDSLSTGYWVPADRIDVNPTMSCILPAYHAIGGYEPTQGTYDWTADAAQRKVAQGAQGYGANLLDAVSYSPPYWMTLSGTSQGGTNGAPNLASGYSGSGSGSFADYLATVAQHFAQNWGITFHHIDPLNEPGQSWWTAGDGKQEGCGFTQSGQASMIQSLATALANKGLAATGVAAMDEFLEGTGNGLSTNTAAAEFYNYDGTTKGNFGRINSHGYSSPAGSVALYNAGMLWGKAVTMSEWGSSDKTGKDISNQIMTDIDQTHVVAFSIWQPDYPSLLTIDYTNQSYALNEAYYVYANFTRFIRPGYRFVAISDPNSVAAFNEKTQTLVIVTKNWSSTNQSNTYNLNNFSSLGSSVTVYRTSATENLANVTGATISNASFNYTANANSVTTFVISGATYGPAASTVNDNTTGTGLNQFNYVGTWSYYNGQTGAYNNDNHWSGNTNDYYTVQFSGTQARVYASMAANSGILAFSVDGGPETYFDSYAASRVDNVLLFATATLANMTHSLKVRVTGLKNPASSGSYVAADRIDVVGATSVVGQGIYRIAVSSTSFIGANQDLQVSSGSLADGGTVNIAADTGATYQRWNVIAAGNGSYRIVNLNSGLDLEDPGYANTNGSKVDQWEDGGAASWNEYWWLTQQVDGTYRISNQASGLDLEVNGTTGAVDQWQDVPGATNERWQLIPISQ